MSDKQVKSKARVAKHGEVFTNPREVNAMLDLVQDQITRIDATFLEPACGSGNFLVEILRRRMAYLNQKYKTSLIQYQPATVQAVCGLYGIELLSDNAAECRERLLETFAQHYSLPFQTAQDYPRVLDTVRRVLAKNIVCGNALTYQTENGGTALRQKYPNGTGVYYTNGAASQNTHYHESRPVQHAILPK